jgi:hypothetical protein
LFVFIFFLQGTQRLTLIVKDRVTGQLLIVPVRVPVLLAPPLPGNPESSPTSKFGPNGVPLASVAERSLRDVGTILVDSPAVKIGQVIFQFLEISTSSKNNFFLILPCAEN